MFLWQFAYYGRRFGGTKMDIELKLVRHRHNSGSHRDTPAQWLIYVP